MIALLATAFAFDCEEVANMERAGVPSATIVSHLNDSGRPVGLDDLGCLLASGVDDDIVRAAARLNARQEGRDTPVVAASTPEVRRLHLELECGSVVLGPSVDGRVHVDGRTTERGRLVWMEEGGRAEARLEESAAAPSGAELPRFGGASASTSRRRLPCADLVVSVPRELPVTLLSTRASVRSVGLAGTLDVTDHFGAVEIVGESPEVRVRTTGGDITVDTAARELHLDTVSGRVLAGAGAGAKVDVNTISGPVWLWGGPLERLDVSAVSGDVHLYGAFQSGGRASLVSHGGDIVARVPEGRVEVSSHEGSALGPERAQRIVGSQPFDDNHTLGPAFASLFSAAPTRWWFPAGAVVAGTLEGGSADYDLQARSFSGRVDVAAMRRVPASTGPVITALSAVRDRLDSCASEQFARSGGSGHAVATLVVGADGELQRLSAPSQADQPERVADGALEACVVASLEGLVFGEGTHTRVRWPVRFQAPLELPAPEQRQRRLRALAHP